MKLYHKVLYHTRKLMIDFGGYDLTVKELGSEQVFYFT